jgi:tetratricopeptide (TPR) repeat protein
MLVKRGQIAESDKIVNGLLKKHKAERDDLRMAYAKLLLESDRREKAREQLELVLKNNPKKVDARYALGVFAFNDGNFDEARKQFEVLAKDPNRGADAHFQLGRIAERQAHYDEALKHYEAVSNGAQALDAAVRRAGVLARLDRTGEAREMLEQMRRQFPPLNHRLRLAEGELLTEAGKFDEALSAYDAGLREQPDDADLLYGRSLVYDKMGKMAEAEADLRTIIAKDGDDARALNALGYLLAVNTPRLEEAKQLTSKALEITPEDAAVIDSMGWVQYKLGQPQDAKSWLEKAYGKAKDPEIAAHLGEVLWVLGQREEARAVWDKALADEPEHRVLKETMQRLTQ